MQFILVLDCALRRIAVYSRPISITVLNNLDIRTIITTRLNTRNELNSRVQAWVLDALVLIIRDRSCFQPRL